MTNEEIEKIDELVMSKSMAKRIAAQGGDEALKAAQEKVRAERYRVLDELAAEAQEMGFYDETIEDNPLIKSKPADLAEVSTLATIAWAINEAGKRAHDNAVAKGFYEDPPRDLERIALIHEEISEAASALRQKMMPMDEHCPEFKSVEIELADAIVRIVDFGRARGWDIGKAMIAKMEYNKTRPYRHNKTC